jgi:uncharacterized protein YybS (DUF2232 family)
MKQVHVDTGQLGGVITTIVNSMFVYSFITFVNSSMLVYSEYLKDYLSPTMGILILAIGSFIWFASYYFIVYPSIMQFNNRQSYIHENPLKADLDEIKEELRQLKLLAENK